MTNRDTQSQVQSQNMEWHEIYSIMSRGYIWGLINKYNINL